MFAFGFISDLTPHSAYYSSDAPSKKGTLLFLQDESSFDMTFVFVHWEVDISNSFTVNQWEVALTSIFKGTKCIDHWKLAQKVTLHWYLTLYRIAKLTVTFMMERMWLYWVIIAHALEMYTPYNLLVEDISIAI